MGEDEQMMQDLLLLRENTWATGDQVVDFLILHDCSMREVARAGIRLIGWDPEQFVLAWLSGDRGMLDG